MFQFKQHELIFVKSSSFYRVSLVVFLDPVVDFFRFPGFKRTFCVKVTSNSNNDVVEINGGIGAQKCRKYIGKTGVK